MAALLLLAPAGARSAFAQTGRTGDSFATVEKQVVSLQPNMVQATVALRIGNSRGSGVIISGDGLVLTAAHVTGGPNRECAISLADGKQLSGKTLGLSPETDFALVKIDGGTALTAAPLGDSSTLRSGQWVVATGHPLGPRTGRPPVVRLGRVLGYSDRENERFPTKVVTDAPLISGDSGGPLFDLTGHVVGINVMIAGGGRRDGISMHTLVNLAKVAMEQLKRAEVVKSGAGNPEFIKNWRQARDQLAAGDAAAALKCLNVCAECDPTDAAVHVQMARAFARRGDPAASIGALEAACARGFNDSEELRREHDFSTLQSQPRFKQVLQRLEAYSGIPGERKNDRALIAAAGRLAPEMGRGCVRMLVDGKEAALGLVMSGDGEILTKASELAEGELKCVLPDGRIVPASIKGTDAQWDVALVKVAASNLQPADFAERYSVGQWTFTPTPDGDVISAGVVGVLEMPVKGRGISPKPSGGGFLGVFVEELSDEQRQMLGLKGGARLNVQAELPAARAGVQSGDVVYQIDREPVGEPDELSDYLAGKKPGDEVRLRLLRGKEKVDLSVTLGARPASAGGGRPSLPAMLSGEVSRMQGPFPAVLHHDAILRPSAMGGPLVNDAGKCIGMNIARADRTSTYALPARTVRQVYENLHTRSAATTNTMASAGR